jgi:2-polyprenyl-6-methoxyphenol hydroxylase-like FAD-dependent oxidoreductase
LADVVMDWGLGRDRVRLFFSPAGLVVVAPLPGGTFRIVAVVEHAPQHPTIADIQALLDERGPVHGRAVVTRLDWSSRFRIHHRLAEHYRNGRLLLVGDAAHVHSPAGGPGMNTGLVDATVLGRMLVSVIRDPGKASLLDDYERMRRPAAQSVLALASRLTEAATMKGVEKRKVRNLVLSTFGKLSVVRDKLALNLSGLSRRDAVWPPDSRRS